MTWEDMLTFEEMFEHITEHRCGFDEAQMDTIRTWMSAASAWQQNRTANRIYRLELILSHCLAEGINSDRFSASQSSDNRRDAREALGLSIADDVAYKALMNGETHL